MNNIINESLLRQEKGLALLHELLEEEYQILLGRDTNTVVALEFSIQELIRQLAVEKSLVIRSLGGKKVKEFAQSLLEEDQSAILALFKSVDDVTGGYGKNNTA